MQLLYGEVDIWEWMRVIPVFRSVFTEAAMIAGMIQLRTFVENILQLEFNKENGASAPVTSRLGLFHKGKINLQMNTKYRRMSWKEMN